MHGKDIYPADRIIIIKITGFQLKSAGNHELFGGYEVTAGLEPVTSCGWRCVGSSQPCYWVLSGTFGPAFCGYKSLPCPLCPPADFLILVSVLVKAPAPPNQAEPGLFLDGKPCCRDSSLNRNDCQVPLSNSDNLLCTIPSPSDGGEIYKQYEK